MTTSIDTNIIISFLMPPVSDSDRVHQAKASALLGAVSDGEIQAIISEIVIHESYYVMVMRFRALTTSEFCEVFQDILSWPGWLIGDQELAIYLRGLEIVEAHPKLEYSDAVIAARAEAPGAELATFDRRLATAYGGPIWADS